MSQTSDQQNNEIDIKQSLTNQTTTNIVVDSTNLSNGDILQYDSTSRQFEPRSVTEAGLYSTGGTDIAVADGGTGASTAANARTNLGLGTIATQDADNVTITGGSISGATVSSSNVTITGGSITGITDLAVADGGTGASTLTGILFGNGTSAITAESTLAVNHGGTGLTSATAYAVLCGGTTSTGAFQPVASVGSANDILTSNGAGALPSFQSLGILTGSQTYISTQAASSQATVDFTGLSSTYIAYLVRLENVVPGTDNVSLYCRVGTGGGPTYASTNEYDYAATGSASVSGTSAAQMIISGVTSGTDTLGSSTGESYSADIMVYKPSQSSLYHLISWKAALFSSAGAVKYFTGTGVYKATTAVTAIRFLTSSGNIASGQFTLYGIKNS